jgi:hypothetical protein
MDNEEIETLKEYTEPVNITVDGVTITWDPKSRDLVAQDSEAQAVANEVSKFIYYSAPDRDVVPATPEGPFLPATTQNLYTVVWAVESLYFDTEVSYEGDAPTMADMGLDDGDGFEEDGTPIVR